MIDVACSLARHIIIGLTSPLFLERIAKKNFADMIEAYETRKQAVERYLRQKDHQDWIIMPIDDKWGGGDKADADALIVSEETYAEGVRINRERTAHGRPPLALVVIPQVIDEEGKTYSSTRLRQEDHKQTKD